MIGVADSLVPHPSDNSVVLTLNDGSGIINVTKVIDENVAIGDEINSYGPISQQGRDHKYLRMSVKFTFKQPRES